MPRVIRPELSKKNPYWIERYRYYELKYFCLQYPTWKKAYQSLDGLSKRPHDLTLFRSNEHGDPTVKRIEKAISVIEKYNLVRPVHAGRYYDQFYNNYHFRQVQEYTKKAISLIKEES